MDWTRIVYVLIIFIVIYYLLSWFLESSVKLSGVRSGKVMEEIEASKTLTKNLIMHIQYGLTLLIGQEPENMVERNHCFKKEIVLVQMPLQQVMMVY